MTEVVHFEGPTKLKTRLSRKANWSHHILRLIQLCIPNSFHFPTKLTSNWRTRWTVVAQGDIMHLSFVENDQDLFLTGNWRNPSNNVAQCSTPMPGIFIPPSEKKLFRANHPLPQLHRSKSLTNVCISSNNLVHCRPLQRIRVGHISGKSLQELETKLLLNRKVWTTLGGDGLVRQHDRS